MKLYPIYQVDAFTNKLFAGNPAAIVPLYKFLPTKKMQSIALENNLSETAFVVARSDGDCDLRWFTPTHEVEFCGHATIAAADIMLSELSKPSPINVQTKIGRLQVSRNSNGCEMCAPAFPMNKIDLIEEFRTAFGIDEDPVTGSNHASLAPFWAKRLGKTAMLAYQASERGGALSLRLAHDKVFITGQAVTYMRGEIQLS